MTAWKPLRSVVAAACTVALGACATDGLGKVDPELETPRYESIERQGRFEIRRYAPYVVAETTVEGTYDEAARQAFRRLAGYIFGGNQGDRKISMTAPVASEVDASSGQRIAMTAPVESTRQEAPSDAASANANTPGLSEEMQWRTSFMMPSRYTLENLPQPNDDRVTFAERPARQIGVIVFDGFVTDAIVRQRLDELQAWLTQHGQRAAGPYTLARYNDPLTLPWNRRNEIHLPLEGS